MDLPLFRPTGSEKYGSLRRQEHRVGILLVVPAIIGVLAFGMYPIIFSLYVSFTNWNLITAPQWIGIQNYISLIESDSTFHAAIVNSTLYALGTVLPGMALAFIIAMLLNQPIRGRVVYRAIFFIPVIAPTVSVALLWTWIYDPNVGILNAALSRVGISGPAWLSSPNWALLAIIIMAIWQGLGYNIVILLAGLQSISDEYYEAASLDGANALQRAIRITLPLLSPATFFVLVLSVINAFQVFTSVYVMTQGGPANATMTAVLNLYQDAFQYQEMGRASAIAYCLFVLLVSLTVVNFVLQRVWVFYDDGQANG